MSRNGPVAIVGSSENSALSDRLTAAGAFPIVAAAWDDGAAAIAKVQPAAVIADLRGVEGSAATAIADACKSATPYTPFIAIGPLGAPPCDALPFTTPELPLDRLDARLTAALRVRTLHSTVLRRVTEASPDIRLPDGDLLQDATVLLVGRGRTYPQLTVALGERMALVGALSIEAAAKHLNVRDIDGVVLGDGFSPRIADAFLTVLAEDSRFRALPIIISGSFAGGALPELANLDIVRGSPDEVVAHAVALVRQHAFEMRLGRTLKALDTGGVIDPATGLLDDPGVRAQLGNKAVVDTIESGGAMSAARFSFDGADARARRDAARILGRLMRAADFAALRDDQSIVTAFAETDLREAHVIVRRLASVLRHTALGPGGKNKIDPSVTLATVKPTDTAETVLAGSVERNPDRIPLVIVAFARDHAQVSLWATAQGGFVQRRQGGLASCPSNASTCFRCSGSRAITLRSTARSFVFIPMKACPASAKHHRCGVAQHQATSRATSRRALIGADPLDHAVLYDRQLHELVKVGPEGAVSGALAAIDIALWDLKGKLLGQPIYKLLGGAWRTALPFYASIGRNGARHRNIDEVCRVVEQRLKDGPAAIKIRFDNDRVTPDLDIKGDIAKARAVRRLVGDDFPLAFDANNGYSPGAAIRVGRALEELGFWWFEEPVQHYHVSRMGEVARALDITVSAGEQTYTTAALVDLINAGVRMVQPISSRWVASPA